MAQILDPNNANSAENIKLELQKRLDRAQQELNVLYDVSTAMRTTLDLEYILYIILTGVTSHTGLGYNRALLFLVNPKSRHLECKMVIGPESEEHANKIWTYIENSNPRLEDLIQEDKVSQTIKHSLFYEKLRTLKFPLGSEQNFLLSEAFKRGAPWHVTHEEISKYLHDPLLQYFHTNELIIMPMRIKDKVNGLIVADNIYTRKPIKTDDLKIFTMLANQAGLAIENSHLYEQFVHKSFTDSLTGLWNHGFFQEELERQLKQAKAKNWPLSLAIIDIDNFKKLNDGYGHQNGDVVLTTLARLFKDSSRDVDFVCRYGGEEFSIVLFQANKPQAYEIAERLRSKIEAHTFADFSPNPNLKMTVSIGVATFPNDASTKEDLIALADKAMYISKFSGKNKVSLADTNNPS